MRQSIGILLERIKQWARRLKTELYALYLAYRDPRVPWYARVVAACVVGYAFSPIDLIPDPIPVIGYLDDLIIVPAGIWLALKLIPRQVMSECRERARLEAPAQKLTNWTAAVIVVGIWLVLAAAAIVLVLRVMER